MRYNESKKDDVDHSLWAAQSHMDLESHRILGSDIRNPDKIIGANQKYW